MGRCEGVHMQLWLLLLCAALACAFAPALAFANVGGASDLAAQTAGAANETDIETTEIGVFTMPLVGSTHTIGGSTYQVTSSDNKTVAFTKSANASNVVVPDTVAIQGQTYRVTAIAPNAFSPAKEKVKTVTIGKNVSTIGQGAFSQCPKLTTVKGGAKVKTIGAKAFSGCKSMKTCAPFSSKELAKVGKQAVSGAKKLTTLTVKSKKLRGKSVKGSLSGSSVKTIKVKVGSKKLNKKYVKKYQKVFAKKYSGKQVTVK